MRTHVCERDNSNRTSVWQGWLLPLDIIVRVIMTFSWLSSSFTKTHIPVFLSLWGHAQKKRHLSDKYSGNTRCVCVCVRCYLNSCMWPQAWPHPPIPPSGTLPEHQQVKGQYNPVSSPPPATKLPDSNDLCVNYIMSLLIFHWLSFFYWPQGFCSCRNQK